MDGFFVHHVLIEQELVLDRYPSHCRFDDILFDKIPETFSIHHRLESEETENSVDSRTKLKTNLFKMIVEIEPSVAPSSVVKINKHM